MFRGEECPYRHETPTDPTDPLSSQRLRDRYFGKDDPVAKKLLSRYEELLDSEPIVNKEVHIFWFTTCCLCYLALLYAALVSTSRVGGHYLPK